MEEAWSFLNQELKRNGGKCRRWCQRLGMEYCLGARLAHIVMTSPEVFPLSSGYSLYNVEDALPRTPESSADWKEVYRWRHPWFNLNLLQLAVIFDNECVVHYLCQHPDFLSADNYRDDSSKLVNYPLHLAFSLFGDPQRTLKKVFDDIPEHLIQEEGMIDLTMERLQGPACKNWEVKQQPRETAVPSTSNDSATQFIAKAGNHLLLHLVQKTDDTFLKAKNPFWEPILITPLQKHNQFEPEAAEVLLRLIFRKIIGPKVRPSTIEIFWKILRCLCAKGITESFYSGLALSLSQDLGQSNEFLPDILLVFCQLTWAISEEPRGEDCLEALSKLFHLTVKARKPYLTAASCVPRPLLQLVIQSIQTWDGDQRDLDRYDYVVEKLQDLMAWRTLKRTCQFIILRATKGDVRELHDLFSYLEDIFPVPFQTLYEELVKQS